MGLHVLVMPGELTTAIGAIGDPEAVREAGFEGMEGVDRVVPISRPYKLASSELFHDGPSVFDIAGRTVGGDKTFCLIAGPVHGRDARADDDRRAHGQGGRRVDAARRRLQAAHVAVRVQGPRAGRPRDPRRGEGGDRAADRHRAARQRTTPTSSTSYADVVQIGARNMQNYALLEVAGKLGLPVLLKRGLSSSLEELLMAADYVLKEGNERVMLCERGIRTFETATRFTLDLSAVPWLKLHTHLPVIVDPSHATGDRRLVEPLARAAAAVGADGIIVEVHNDPEAALCDGPHSLYAHDFPAFARRVAAHAELDGKDDRLIELGAPRAVADRRVGEPREDLALALLRAELALDLVEHAVLDPLDARGPA